MSMRVAVVLAGGMGTRLGAGIPKQFIEVKGKTVLQYCLETFHQCGCIDKLWIAAGGQWQDKISKMVELSGLQGIFAGFSCPGQERQLSIRNALIEIMASGAEDDYVLIHDGARPLVSTKLICRCFEAACGHEGAIPVLPVKDTIYLNKSGCLTAALNREEMAAGQAPEVFQLGPYYRANEALMPEKIIDIHGSAEPAIMAGMDIVAIPGEERNFKITTPEDLDYFRYLQGEY